MKNSYVLFLRNFAIDSDQIQFVATACLFVEAYAIYLFCTSSSQGRDLADLIL